VKNGEKEILLSVIHRIVLIYDIDTAVN